jgi:hypothetical protein
MTKDEFLFWEDKSRDTIDIKCIYIDIAGDIVTGLLLSQIIYWNLPSKEGKSKLRVRIDGELYLAKKRTDWYDECRITAKQYDRSIKVLEEKGLVTLVLKKFDGSPTTHIKLNFDVLIQAVKTGGKLEFPQRVKTESESEETGGKLEFTEKGISPKGKNQFDQRGKSLTETTSEITLGLGINTRVREDEKNEDIKTEADEVRAEIIKGESEIGTSAAVEPSDFEKAVQLWEGELKGSRKKVYGHEYRDIKKLVEGQGLVLFTEALRESVFHGADIPMKYIKSTMERWAKKGITTIEGVKADQAEFEAKKEADNEKLRILQGQFANRRKSASSKYEDYEEKNNLTPKPVSKYQKFYQ